MTAYYNEFDPKAAAWLRELIADGQVAPGEVDERDIRDVTPNELRSFRQVHLFAGIGGWSAALRKAGWLDSEPVWTASCPCQPFSAAGGRGGFADERHLWPAVYHLATQCRPAVLLGEQSSSKDGLAWLDLVSADMEAAGYAGGALDLCSAGFGAPNIRQRSYFVWLADADGRNTGAEGLQRSGEHGQRPEDAGHSEDVFSGAARGFWSGADWVLCRDEDGPTWRPVEPGSFPLAPSVPGRVALLRGAGNAINIEVAAGFVEAVIAVRSNAERLAA